MPKKFVFTLVLGKLKRRIFKHYDLIRKAIVVGAVMLVLVLAGIFLTPFIKLGREFIFGPVNIFSVVFNRDGAIKNDNGRTNVLLLGIGGAGHEGPNLTDAVMVLSVMIGSENNEKMASPSATIISIPRDIYLDSLQDKINSAYKLGLEKGVGTTLAKGVVSTITGLPIHYAVVIDFSVFGEIVDILGGIDVQVERTLDDFDYPIAGKEADTCGMTETELVNRRSLEVDSKTFPCRFEQLKIEAGKQHMDGLLALKFVRSRHAKNEEGTDFARSRRQQLVLQAIQEKILSSETLASPQKIGKIYDQIKSRVSTDIDPAELSKALNLAIKNRTIRVKTVVIGQEFFVNPPIDYRGWILLPKTSDWNEVREFLRRELETEN